LVLLIFTATAAVAVWFHEPWSDEAQAWLIARDLGIRGILHQMGYEGSPPLWHLLLWVLIRLHLPYAALGAVSLTLVAAGMYIWLRWSPLPLPVRLLVPFAFYYQYQYAVVARSYALSTFLAFAAVALWRAKPFRVIPFGLVVALLAQTNMHGFMIAGGIACAFAWECIKDFRKQRHSLTQVLQTGVASVLVLASAAVARSLAKPLPDCSFKAAIQFKKGATLASIASGLSGLPKLSTALSLNMTWGLSLLLIFAVWAIAAKKGAFAFILPSIVTLVLAYQMSTGKPAFFGIDGGVVLLILVLSWFLAVKRLACALPFLFTVFAMGLIWSRPWHYGMALTAFLVSVWGAWPARQSPEFETPTKILAVSLAVLLIFQLPLTAKTVRDEVQGQYSGARATAEFLRPYVGSSRPIYCVNFYGTGVQAYYDRNIFADWPTAFWTWSMRSASESNRILHEPPPNNAIVVVPSGGKSALELATSKFAKAQLAKRRFLRRYEFCGAQFWLGRVSEYECYEIYERQLR
jgi:hypothetical protein